MLIDTHILAWTGSQDPRLSDEARAAIEESDDDLFVSSVVAFEYVELLRRGRFVNPVPFEELLDALEFSVAGFPAEAWRLAETLPLIHRDPVDRMLVAHAMVLDTPIVTADTNIHRYDVRTIA